MYLNDYLSHDNTSRFTIALLRHAERDPIPNNTIGNEVNLNQAGIQQCLTLSKSVGNELGALYSSPIARCLKTAELLTSHCQKTSVIASTLLGNPGIFVDDAEKATPVFLNQSLLSIAKTLANPNNNPPGFCNNTKLAIDTLINFFSETANPSKLNLYITHDSILAVLIAYCFGEKALKTLWPDYLEGIYLQLSKTTVTLMYRNLVCEINLSQTH